MLVTRRAAGTALTNMFLFIAFVSTDAKNFIAGPFELGQLMDRIYEWTEITKMGTAHRCFATKCKFNVYILNTKGIVDFTPSQPHISIEPFLPSGIEQTVIYKVNGSSNRMTKSELWNYIMTMDVKYYCTDYD